MLADTELFSFVEAKLREDGIIDRFEQEHGKIRGRMMINVIELPEELGITPDPDRQWYAFEATFDFYDTAIGIALYPHPLEAASNVWMTPQTEEAKQPTKEWIDFFIKTLVNSIDQDGSFGVPIYTFMSDTGDFSCVPTATDGEA